MTEEQANETLLDTLNIAQEAKMLVARTQLSSVILAPLQMDQTAVTIRHILLE